MGRIKDTVKDSCKNMPATWSNVLYTAAGVMTLVQHNIHVMSQHTKCQHNYWSQQIKKVLSQTFEIIINKAERKEKWWNHSCKESIKVFLNIQCKHIKRNKVPQISNKMSCAHTCYHTWTQHMWVTKLSEPVCALMQHVALELTAL